MPIQSKYRTVFIKVETEAGTAFTVDYQGKMYLVTARHVVEGVSATRTAIQVWKEEQWKGHSTVRTIYPTFSEVGV
jgi:hypothetical protein